MVMMDQRSIFHRLIGSDLHFRKTDLEAVPREDGRGVGLRV